MKKRCEFCKREFESVNGADYRTKECAKKGIATMNRRCGNPECFTCLHMTGEREDKLPACYRPKEEETRR